MTGGETFDEHGRHRPGSASWIPLPDPGHHHAHTRTVVGPPGVLLTEPTPIEPAEIVLTTAPITGLASFDIGTVPASVTPPSTWRKAALFAVVASAGVLIALAAAATAFVGAPNDWSTIDGLPGLPGATDSITTPPSPSSAAAGTHPGRTTVPSSGESPDQVRIDPTTSGVDGAVPVDPARPTTTTTTATPSSAPRSSSTTTTDAPVRTTLTPLVPSPPVNAQQIGDRTEAYYDNVVDDPPAAYAMTTGPMQSEGPDGIKRRYQDVTDVQVEEITIDPSTARTTNTICLHHKDGTVTTQQRVLTFSAGDDPRITNETTA